MDKEEKPALTFKQFLINKNEFRSMKIYLRDMPEYEIERLAEEYAKFAQPEATYLDKEKVKDLLREQYHSDIGINEFFINAAKAICQLAIPEKSEGIGMSEVDLYNKIYNIHKRFYGSLISPNEKATGEIMKHLKNNLSKPAVVVEPNEEVETLKMRIRWLNKDITKLDDIACKAQLELKKLKEKAITAETIAEALPSLADAENEYYNNETPFDGEHEGWIACYEYMRQQAMERLSGKIVLDRKNWVYEDELPEMTEEEYSKWFETSEIVDGVRMGYPVYLSIPTTTKEESK